MKLRSVIVQSALLVCLLAPALAFAQTTTTDTGFVPLTHFPQIKALSQSQGFGDFANTLYRILIGAGAVLAVIMIMYAGVQFMTSRGSVASNEKARSRIQNALLGLLLVLAPTIVFGIINPSILRIDLGQEFAGLKQQNGINQDAFAPPSTNQNNTSNTCPQSPQAVQGDMCPTGSQPISQSCCTGISLTGVCCAPKSNSNTSAQPQGGDWGWKIKFTGGGSSAGVYTQKGPFSTQKECLASLQSFVAANQNLTETEDQPCACGQTMSSQPNCHL